MSELITDLDTIRRLAERRAPEFEALRVRLENDETLDDGELDALIDGIAQPIIDGIDCKTCANCCRTAQVALRIQDVARLSKALLIPPSQIITHHVNKERGAEVGEWGTLKAQPCPFLNGNLCSVYEHRPESCAIYPEFTPDFRWTLWDSIDGAGTCPIIYNVLDAVSEALM